MTREDKLLLLKDLCGRVIYGVLGEVSFYANSSIKQAITFDNLEGLVEGFFDVKPYLRPMSSMTEEEWTEYEDMCDSFRGEEFHKLIDWLSKKMFDYRGLIPMGLALEAPEGMYKTE